MWILKKKNIYLCYIGMAMGRIQIEWTKNLTHEEIELGGKLHLHRRVCKK
jgi:hypothetical protein